MKTDTTSPRKKIIFDLPDGGSMVVRGDGKNQVMTVPAGMDVFVCPPRNPKKIAAAARAIKKAMPKPARPGQQTATDILAELRGER